MLKGKDIVKYLDCVLLGTTVWGVSQGRGRQTIRDGVFLSLANNRAGWDDAGSGKMTMIEIWDLMLIIKGTEGVTSSKSNDCDKAKQDRGLKSDGTETDRKERGVFRV